MRGWSRPKGSVRLRGLPDLHCLEAGQPPGFLRDCPEGGGVVWSPAPYRLRYPRFGIRPGALRCTDRESCSGSEGAPEDEATLLPVASETESALLCGQGHEICAILWTKVVKLSSAAARDGDSQCSVGAEHRPGQADLKHLCSTAQFRGGLLYERGQGSSSDRSDREALEP